MKEKIYTIPVNDAFRRNDRDCPLCVLREGLETQLLDYYLGPSLMEPDVRVSTNERGFCRTHANALHARENNRLGLGLMLHTRLTRVTGSVGDALRKAGGDARRGWTGRRKDWRDALRAAAAGVRAETESCIVCDRLADTMARYLDVTCWLYAGDDAFRAVFRGTHHFCVPHLADLLDAAASHLGQADADAMLGDLRTVAARSLGEMEHDIEWFTLKFDYRNNDKPWGNSKDAVIRAIRTLAGGTSPDAREKNDAH
ncbi:MAG: ABC transporter substrate-binding protein [Clostridia bacterium]|nr:ABC transporter substrate-binding protein [Clostridia bacterium]